MSTRSLVPGLAQPDLAESRRGVSLQAELLGASLLCEETNRLKAEAKALTALQSPPQGHDPLRHILLGSPGNVRQTIHLLHMLRYAENVLWSPLVTIPNEELIITPRPGDVMSILFRHMG